MSQSLNQDAIDEAIALDLQFDDLYLTINDQYIALKIKQNEGKSIT